MLIVVPIGTLANVSHCGAAAPKAQRMSVRFGTNVEPEPAGSWSQVVPATALSTRDQPHSASRVESYTNSPRSVGRAGLIWPAGWQNWMVRVQASLAVT